MATTPVELVNIVVDGKPLQVPKDKFLLWSLRDLYFDIPHFCAHKWLNPPFGGCRMCMVEIAIGGKKMPKLQTSCTTMPVEGMEIWTQTEPVTTSRKEQLEFHLINHPLECPTCDKGGECMLQDQTFEHGVPSGRFIDEKRVRPDTILNDFIRMNYKRCFQCKRCVHFGEMVDGEHLLKFVKRGADTRIESFPQPGEAPRFSGNLIDICPVGALTARAYRFMGRPWEQEPAASVGSLDSVGANIWLCARLGELTRIIPRDNDSIEFGLIDDVTRFHYECIDDPRRVTEAALHGPDGSEQLSQSQGWRTAAQWLSRIIGEHGPDSVGLIAGSGLNTEEYLALRRFAGTALDTQYYHFGEELLGPVADLRALHALTRHTGSIANIVNAGTVLAVGCDPNEEAPALSLRIDLAARQGSTRLLTLRSSGSDFDRFATLHAQYGYGNLLRTVRALTNALTGGGETLPELQPLADALRSSAPDCAILFGAEVWRSEDPAELLRALAALRNAIAAANENAPVWLNGIYPGVNSAGALALTHLGAFGGQLDAAAGQLPARPAAGSLHKLLQAGADGRLKALIIVDVDLLSTYPDRALLERALNNISYIIYAGPFVTPTSERAGLHLPLGTYAHREGTVVNLEWRVQKRERARIGAVAAGVLEICNGITGGLDKPDVALDVAALSAALRAALPGYAQASLSEFPLAGEFAPGLREAGDSTPPPAAISLPPEFTGNGDAPLVLAPKRFLYNDRPEIRYSTVFDRVPRPFQAYLNPADLTMLNLSADDQVELSVNGAGWTLPLKPASWVRPGSIVINDYCHSAPANSLGGFGPQRIALKRVAAAAATASATAAAGGGE